MDIRGWLATVGAISRFLKLAIIRLFFPHGSGYGHFVVLSVECGPLKNGFIEYSISLSIKLMLRNGK